MVFFGFPTEIQKTQGVFAFHQRPSKKNKTNCVFWFPFKIKKHVMFWISVGKPKKTLGRPNKNKSFGPLRKVLGFWSFVFLVSPVVTCGLLNCSLLVSTGILKLKRI